jgi:hypothetical protein
MNVKTLLSPYRSERQFDSPTCQKDKQCAVNGDPIPFKQKKALTSRTHQQRGGGRLGNTPIKIAQL